MILGIWPFNIGNMISPLIHLWPVEMRRQHHEDL